MPVNYKTLPHNRDGKASNSVVRFSNEAEFITQSSLTFNQPDVRYTAEGCYAYVNVESNNFPSPPDAYKTNTISDNVLILQTVNSNRNYSPVQQDQKWPSVLSGYQNTRYHRPPPQSREIFKNNVIHEVEEDEDECNININLKSNIQLTPDEGYVDDGHENFDIQNFSKNNALEVLLQTEDVVAL